MVDVASIIHHTLSNDYDLKACDLPAQLWVEHDLQNWMWEEEQGEMLCFAIKTFQVLKIKSSSIRLWISHDGENNNEDRSV